MTDPIIVTMIEPQRQKRETEYRERSPAWEKKEAGGWESLQTMFSRTSGTAVTFPRYDNNKYLPQNTITYPWEYPPARLTKLADTIKGSKYLIDIPDETEFNGPKPVDKGTWEKGCKYLWRHAEKLLDFSKIQLEPPLISATPKGGLRFYWNKADYRMLITIHPGENCVTYYGDNAKWENWEERETTVNELDYKLISWFTLVL